MSEKLSYKMGYNTKKSMWIITGLCLWQYRKNHITIEQYHITCKQKKHEILQKSHSKSVDATSVVQTFSKLSESYFYWPPLILTPYFPPHPNICLPFLLTISSWFRHCTSVRESQSNSFRFHPRPRSSENPVQYFSNQIMQMYYWINNQ